MGIFLQAGCLGEQLTKMGIITEEQLMIALKIQKQRRSMGKKVLLGQVLIDLGYCTEDQIAQAMSRKTGFQLKSVNKTGIDMTCANLITPEIAVKYKLIPIGMKDGKLQVAMQNPSDIIAIDDIQLLTGYEVEPIVVPDHELSAIIEQFCNISKNIEQQSEDGIEEDEKDSFDTIDDADINEKPAVLLVNQILNHAIRVNASDIHIEPQEKYIRVRFRIDGVLHEIMEQPKRLHPLISSRIKVMAGMDIAERRIPQDGRITLKVDEKIIDIRVASLPSAYGEKLTMRLFVRNETIITLEQLGFPEVQLKRYNEIMYLPYGFILITGPTGSGKSTTLYATLAEINTPDKNVITLEDPVERRMEGLNQIQMNNKAGMTFASGLRAILRSDPDIIMVGEIRDKETAQIAVESALTGHLVFSTLHTNDSSGAVSRLTEMGIEPFLTASSLVGVIAQRLVRVLCPLCRKSYEISRQELLQNIPDFPLDEDEDLITLYKSSGCLSCNNTGFKGRTGVFEFLKVTDNMQKLILNRASTNEIRDLAIKEGMDTLRADGLKKVKSGITSLEELLRVVV
ncbi:MAG: Flp pilus assembly complex ATPase component TadA [Clostridiaceae bacterium]|nr:Flp pilus assembly complex ATPase component TadA [Clostridiaceae bacterium]